MASTAEVPRWTFLTNHGHVLICIANDPDVRISELADLVGIRERAAQNIVNDLVVEGYVTRTKVGRRNRYTVHGGRPLRHPLERSHRVGELLQVLTDPAAATNTASAGVENAG